MGINVAFFLFHVITFLVFLTQTYFEPWGKKPKIAMFMTVITRVIVRNKLFDNLP